MTFIRYNLLTEFCRKKKIKTIFTAHNLEDQVETFLSDFRGVVDCTDFPQ